MMSNQQPDPRPCTRLGCLMCYSYVSGTALFCTKDDCGCTCHQNQPPPTPDPRDAWHLMASFVAVCGANYPNMRKTEIRENVTCPRCLAQPDPRDVLIARIKQVTEDSCTEMTKICGDPCLWVIRALIAQYEKGAGR